MTKKWQKKVKFFLSAEKSLFQDNLSSETSVLPLQILRACLQKKTTLAVTLPDSTNADRLTGELLALTEKLDLRLDLLQIPECGRGKLLFPGGESRRARALDDLLNKKYDLVIGSINSLLGPAQSPAEIREAALILEPDMEIPQGAEERLDALINSLESDASILPAGEKEVEKERKRQLGIPRFVLQGAAAAAVVIAACIFAYDDASLHIEQTASLVAEHVEETEEDTFDNPEDAMKCFKAVVGDIKLALITTESNTREIGNTLNDAFMPYRDIIRINI